MIHVLGWVAVTLTAAHSYLSRPFPPGKDHRTELPAIGFGVVMVLVMILLVSVTGVGGEASKAELPGPTVVWVPLT